MFCHALSSRPGRQEGDHVTTQYTVSLKNLEGDGEEEHEGEEHEGHEVHEEQAGRGDATLLGA